MRKTNIILSVLFVALLPASGWAQPQGSIAAWGWNAYGQSTPPTTAGFIQVAGGHWHSVGLRSDGSIQSWGSNFYGQLNNPGGTGFTQVACGASHNHALRSDGSIVSWGPNWNGEINNPTGTGFIQVADTLALRSDGSIVTWGGGRPTSPPGKGFIYIGSASGYCRHALRSDGSIVSWGNNIYGQITNTPTGTGFTQVEGGGSHSLALDANGTIFSWGRDNYGQVSKTPKGTGFTQVAGGRWHSLALRSDGSIVSWGDDGHGKVSKTPPGTGFNYVAAGVEHSLAIDGWSFVANYATFGTACGTKPPMLAASAGSLPRSGSLFSLSITNLSTWQSGAVITGVSSQAWGAISLPFDLSPIGMTGCVLYVSGEWQTPFTSGFGTTYNWSVTIPNQRALLGLQFHNQAFVIDPGANPLGVVISNAGTGTIGF